MDTNDLVVVTGAGGFIGGHLVAELRRRHHRGIRAVDIKPLDEWYQVFDDVENCVLDQVRQAIAGREDLGLPVNVAAERLSGDASYDAAFQLAFASPVSADRLVQAIATFVRGARAGGSPVDRYLAGDSAALTPAARRGYALFTGVARCSRCHAGPLFTDEEFHNTGVSWGRDPGRFEVTGVVEDRGRFKTPSLRNLPLTAPYMHDGSVGTLERVVEFYDRGGRANPNLDTAIRPLGLSAGQRTDLVSFLRALSMTVGG